MTAWSGRRGEKQGMGREKGISSDKRQRTDGPMQLLEAPSIRRRFFRHRRLPLLVLVNKYPSGLTMMNMTNCPQHILTHFRRRDDFSESAASVPIRHSRESGWERKQQGAVRRGGKLPASD